MTNSDFNSLIIKALYENKVCFNENSDNFFEVEFWNSKYYINFDFKIERHGLGRVNKSDGVPDYTFEITDYNLNFFYKYIKGGIRIINTKDFQPQLKKCLFSYFEI